MMNQPTMPPSGAAAPLKTDLQENAIGLIGATMQCVTHIAPAIAALFFTQFVVTQAGITAPLAYLIGFILVLMLGNTLAQLARHIPSAGGYYTYVSRAISPRAGFLTSWMYILYSPIVAPVFGYFGFIVSGELKAVYDIDLPWLWLAFAIIGPPIVAAIQYRGMKFSAEAMLVLGGLEMLVVFVLAVSGFLSPGPGGISLDVFNPAMIPTFGGFALAVVFTVQGLTGWEASAPLAEETSDPKRNVPLSVFLSITIIGFFLVFVFWGVISGFGSDNVQGIIDSETLPALALANRLWGPGTLIILFAFLNSVFAVGLATANVSTRMWYGMARSGSFPKALAKVDPAHKTPINAILLQMVISVALGVVGGYVFGPDVAFFFLVGLILVLGVTFVYLMANVAVFRFYWIEKRAEFNWLLHAVFPAISSAVLIYAVYASFFPDLPAEPYRYAPLVDGAWLLIGIAILFWMRSRGREEWLLNAGKAVGEA
jgi:amino acid transporter